MKRLSSDFLYHYKRDINVVKLILQYGFRHNMWDEKVIFRNSVQQNFIVSFCDILKDQAESHKSCYGDIAIVMTKKWGINNNISPVRYIHKNSLGSNENYVKIKNLNREIWEQNATAPNYYQYATDYIGFGLAKDSGLMPQPSIKQSSIAEPRLSLFLENFDTESKEIEDELRKIGKFDQYAKYLHTLGNRLLELHNELEARDAFLRVYQDDFDCPASGKTIPSKVLYDEREWRSVKFIDNKDFASNPDEYKQAVTNRYLPSRFNLMYNSDDFIAILVNNQNQIDDLVEYISNHKTLIDPKTDLHKIKLYSDFND
jgi:hypothetical protein